MDKGRIGKRAPSSNLVEYRHGLSTQTETHFIQFPISSYYVQYQRPRNNARRHARRASSRGKRTGPRTDLDARACDRGDPGVQKAESRKVVEGWSNKNELGQKLAKWTTVCVDMLDDSILCGFPRGA